MVRMHTVLYIMVSHQLLTHQLSLATLPPAIVDESHSYEN